MSQEMHRRDFLKRTALLATAAGITRLGAAEETPTVPKSATDKLNVGFIGAGGKAEGNLAGIGATGSNIVALCDIDSVRLAKSAANHKGAQTYTDFRKLLEQKDIDAIIVTTPDHTHAIAAMSAMKMGKHVYVEKPMCKDIFETRTLTEAARKFKLVTQMGNHGTASEYIRRQAEWVHSGAIGTVKEIHCWSDRPGNSWPQGMNRPVETPPVPANVAWDLWLGTAPERPYNPAYHPFKWRGFWDFGTGALGDMGCHIINYPFFTFRLPAPSSVECVGSEGLTAECPPKWSIIKYEFPASGDRPSTTLTWYDGGKKPELPKGIKKLTANGTIYVGDKGVICAPYDQPAELAGEPDNRGPKPSLPRSPGHYKEFVAACKGGSAPGANFDYAGPLTELVLMGNVAVRAGKKLEWDSANLKFTNAPEANQYLRREYRAGWAL